MRFAGSCQGFWVLLEHCNVKRVAKLSFQDDWLKLVTNCHIVQLRKFSSKVAAPPLVEAERDKCRRGKIAFLIRSQVNRVERQLSRNFVTLKQDRKVKTIK